MTYKMMVLHDLKHAMSQFRFYNEDTYKDLQYRALAECAKGVVCAEDTAKCC